MSKFIVPPCYIQVHLVRETLPAGSKETAVEPASNREHTTAMAQTAQAYGARQKLTRRSYSRHAETRDELLEPLA